jgi:hypothetical protein
MLKEYTCCSCLICTCTLHPQMSTLLYSKAVANTLYLYRTKVQYSSAVEDTHSLPVQNKDLYSTGTAVVDNLSASSYTVQCQGLQSTATVKQKVIQRKPLWRTYCICKETCKVNIHLRYSCSHVVVS